MVGLLRTKHVNVTIEPDKKKYGIWLKQVLSLDYK